MAREKRIEGHDEERGGWVVPVSLHTMSALVALGITDPEGYQRLMAECREKLEAAVVLAPFVTLTQDQFANTLGYPNWTDLIRESEDFGTDSKGRHWYVSRIDGPWPGQIVGYAAWRDPELQVGAVHFAASYTEAVEAVFKSRTGMPVS